MNADSRSAQVSSPPVIKSSLIEPDGGALVDLVVPESERGPKTMEAESMPKVKLTKIDLEWAHVISEGWSSPVRGFMRESEYLQSLHFNCLKMKNGTTVNMSLPIVLAIDDETKERVGSSNSVGLIGPNGDLIGILRRSVYLMTYVHFFCITVFCAIFLFAICYYCAHYVSSSYSYELAVRPGNLAWHYHVRISN